MRTGSTDAAAASLPGAGPDQTVNPEVSPHGRPLVVAFVVGTHGTVASDLLAPYDIFASSPAFTTFVVADTTAPAPLEGGPAVVATHTFAAVDADPALAPDLVVVPALTHPTGTTEAPLRNWLTRQHDHGAKVLGVCSGSLVLAATGMLDGLDATSHWSRISALEADRPAVNWLRGRRYVEDGSVTTTAAVTSGVQPPSTSSPSSPGPLRPNESRTSIRNWAGPRPRRPSSPRTTSSSTTGPWGSTT